MDIVAAWMLKRFHTKRIAIWCDADKRRFIAEDVPLAELIWGFEIIEQLDRR